MDPWAVVGALAGAAVAASVPQAVSRAGPRGGWLAAAPITPTLALLFVGPATIDWGTGLAVVAGATVGLVAPAVLRRAGAAWRPLPTMAAVGAAFVVGLIHLSLPLASAGVLAAALAAGRWAYARLPTGPVGRRRARWRWMADFLAIAAALLALPWAARHSPPLAGVLASSPLLLAASLAATQHQAGAAGVLAVGHGAMGASLGVAAFVAAAWALSGGALSAWLTAALGWAAFAAAVAAWNLLTPSSRTAGRPSAAAGP